MTTDQTLSLPRRPKADTQPVDELVEEIRAGRIRIPQFQTGLRWQAEDVRKLFDSIYRGYPIGSLLLWKRHERAAMVRLGPIVINAPEQTDAWSVVDGQQRLTALAVSLTEHASDDERFQVFFDLRTQSFEGRPRDSSPPPAMWLPLSKVLDAVDLAQWLATNDIDEAKSRIAHQLGKRIREYRFPMYIVDTEEEEILREIFRRVNNWGRRLDQSQVFDALVGRRGGEPARLDDLADSLTSLGMGRVTESVLMQAALGIRGRDVTRRLDSDARTTSRLLSGVVEETDAAMRRTLSFLRRTTQVTHLRLLPYPLPLIVLARFFHMHPNPQPRSIELLRRWLWRGILSGAHVTVDKTRLRKSVNTIGKSEEGSVQELLALVPHTPPDVDDLRGPFDARRASSRTALIALLSYEPRDLVTGEVLDTSAVFDRWEAKAIRHVVNHTEEPLRGGIVNRIVHPLGQPVRRLVAVADRKLLSTHAISLDAFEALHDRDFGAFFENRRLLLRARLEVLAEKNACWNPPDRDRPTVMYLMRGT